jgi:NADH:ubiquinone oxidoreductase subunit 6 (subunit J)
VTPASLGQQLVTTLVLPFEVISLVFVAAMVGAILLAAPRR